MGFTSTFNRGFQMTFDNGLTISVQWGRFNYCERKKEMYLTDELMGTTINSMDAEIAIWDKGKDTWLDFGSDQVKGWCTANEVADWIYKVSLASSLESLQESIMENNK
jgi:hypothetical protein